IVYSYYRSQKYTIYNAKATDFKPIEVSPTAINFDAAILPPVKSVGVNLVNANLDNFERFETVDADSIKRVPYRPQFKLDYIASSGVGASVGGRFGSGLAGGIQAIFSDILGANQIFAAANVNGEIQDFGGQVAFINQKRRVNFGVSVSHIPYISGFAFDYVDPNNGAYVVSQDIMRTFEDQVQLFGSYPFSRIHRFEASTAVAHYSYRVDRYSTYYNPYTGQAVDADRTKIPRDSLANDPIYAGSGMNFSPFTAYTVSAAFVGDNALMGITAPLDGFRYRVGIDRILGDINFSTLTVDLRKYTRFKPVTFAARLLNNSRIGEDANRFYPLFLGYPYLIRGYEANSFYKRQQGANDFNINNLTGTSIAVANLEFRLPFTGPKRLSAVESKFLFSDLNAFFDMGVAYSEGSEIIFGKQKVLTRMVSNPQDPTGPKIPQDYNDPSQSVVAMSAGLSLRVNVFGYFVIEPYAAIPFQRDDVSGPVFGLTFAPGW
ncbi:MAG: tolB protein precursor, partial [Sphingobacteriaceae bacterium]